MAIQVRTASSTDSLSSPLAISSTGIQEGDLVLLHLRTTNDVAPSVVPDGFALIANGEIAGTNSIRIYSKVAGASEPATYSFTWPSGNARIGILVLYSSTGVPIELDASANQSNASSTTYTFPGVTTTAADTLLSCFLSISVSVATIAGSGMTERYPGGVTSSVHCQTVTVSGIGATGTKTATGAGTTSRAVTAAWRESSVIPFAPKRQSP